MGAISSDLLRQRSLRLWFDKPSTLMKRILPFIIILLVLGVALGYTWYLKRATTDIHPISINVNSTAPTNSPQAVSTAGVPGAEPAHTLESANAPVHLEEFGDFECPPCGLLHPILLQMHRE